MNVTAKTNWSEMYNDAPTNRATSRAPRVKSSEVPRHTYMVGQTLIFSPSFGDANTLKGAYKVTNLLPADSNGNQYRIKSVADGRDRVVHENQLSWYMEPLTTAGSRWDEALRLSAARPSDLFSDPDLAGPETPSAKR
jgi:hypothetical protein